MKHHRIVVTKYGGPEVLQAIEEDIPEPNEGEVRVKVLVAGVSAYDLMFRSSGRLPGTPKPPFTLGEDVVGTVDKLGENVTSLQPGQMVAGWSMGDGGGDAEYVSRPVEEFVPVPEGIDPAIAVSIVVNYLTAHLAMHETAKVRKGERVLIQGAAGGTGSALLDLGRLAELELYGTASAHNHARVAAFGATPIDYRSEDFVARMRELTGDGADAVFDMIGGARQVWRSYQALRDGGRLVWFGVAGTKRHGLRVIPLTLPVIALLKLLPGSKRILNTPDFSKDMNWYRETLAELMDLLAAGKLNPIVAERVPLTEASRAHEILESGQYAGKIVLVTGG